ncbi:hypothetical protein SAMN05216490_3206 [Mucilaginibacter mallensis]|uniref:Uncharacterized protein n=1 Tax=Mucilaginibacter mallensis TaxID=652787 RepID=A0A1H1ZQJ9_MUCMA|nr:hypothetical protein SAMN05216490_3206 [Mucilaginibacter mallensis]
MLFSLFYSCLSVFNINNSASIPSIYTFICINQLLNNAVENDSVFANNLLINLNNYQL